MEKFAKWFSTNTSGVCLNIWVKINCWRSIMASTDTFKRHKHHTFSVSDCFDRHFSAIWNQCKNIILFFRPINLLIKIVIKTHSARTLWRFTVFLNKHWQFHNKFYLEYLISLTITKLRINFPQSLWSWQNRYFEPLSRRMENVKLR